MLHVHISLYGPQQISTSQSSSHPCTFTHVHFKPPSTLVPYQQLYSHQILSLQFTRQYSISQHQDPIPQLIHPTLILQSRSLLFHYSSLSHSQSLAVPCYQIGICIMYHFVSFYGTYQNIYCVSKDALTKVNIQLEINCNK